VILCRVLGPVAMEVDGVSCQLGGPRQRRALAALATGSGMAVDDSVLAQLVWGEELTGDVIDKIRVVVHRLRAALGPAGAAAIERAPGGYRLATSTDAELFAMGIDEGVQALAAGRAADAVELLTDALRLWRGEPWVELGDALQLSAIRARMIELRDTAFDHLQAARLTNGVLALVVAELTQAVVETPYRERRWELLSLALYRSGRQAQALAELRHVRRLFADELGVEPGPALRKLEQRMLDQDPELLLTATTGSSAPSADTRATCWTSSSERNE